MNCLDAKLFYRNDKTGDVFKKCVAHHEIETIEKLKSSESSKKSSKEVKDKENNNKTN